MGRVAHGTASKEDPRAIRRREFIVLSITAGLAAASTVLGVNSVLPSLLLARSPRLPKAWEVVPGVVDYARVRAESYGPPELGFAKDIRQSPPSERVLEIAQWYDYWPGSVVASFGDWMEAKWGVSGVSVRWTSNIYTSNEALRDWVLAGRRFDLMFPTNYMVETLEKLGELVNLNKDWIPSHVNLFGRVPFSFPPAFETTRDELLPSTYPGLTDEYGSGYNNHGGADFRDPSLNGYASRGNLDTYPVQKPHPQSGTWDEADGLLAVPYLWGTTGIGFRSDVFRRADVEALGWNLFEQSSYTNPFSGQTYDLQSKMMLLNDPREVFTAALKTVGWVRQEDFRTQGLTTADPTAIVRNRGATQPPGSSPATYAESPFNSEYQWSSNETEDGRLEAASSWLRSIRPRLWGFNTAQQGPWLVSGNVYADQIWSGDMVYAARPNSSQFLPIDYVFPKEGSTCWIDCAVIHRESDKLWLAHAFIDYLLDAGIGAEIAAWTLYPTPNAWSFEILHQDPAFSYSGIYPDGSPYTWNPAEDPRIYADLAFGYSGRPILERCERHRDLGIVSAKIEGLYRQIRG